MQIAVMLHNVRSAHNVGSIFRTADAVGVAKIYLTGYTPTPRDRFGRTRKDIAKVSLGAEQYVPWEYEKSPRPIIARLKSEVWTIVGVEQDPRAKNYRLIRTNKRIVFVFGNEVRGLPQSVRGLCDKLVEIPMRGAMVRQAHHPRHTKRGKESLNVAVAAGIVLFSVR